ncbi:MAG: hypothetical protein ACHQ1H_05150, partial [Nitrososphaerales archaeon]
MMRRFLVVTLFCLGLTVFAIYLFIADYRGFSTYLSLGIALFLLVTNSYLYLHYRREYKEGRETLIVSH